MTSYQKITYCIERRLLNKAFAELQEWIVSARAGAYSDQAENLQTSYRYLLDYFARNVDDPQRKVVYRKLQAGLYELADQINADVQERESVLFDYVQMRLFKQRMVGVTPAGLLRNLTDFYDGVATRRVYEETLEQLFGCFWLYDSWTDEWSGCYVNLMTQPGFGENEKSLVVTALTLNLWRRFSMEKLLLLFDSCLQADDYVRGRALVGLCFLLAKYDRRLPLYPDIDGRLQLLMEQTETMSVLKTVVSQIIRSTQTEEISQKLKNEIIPEMLKANPRLREKMNNEAFLKIEDIEEPNPEWTEFLEESGIGKKLRELTELQLEGADVYMSTFSALRSLPFFEQTSHWFMLFDKDFSDIAPLFADSDKSILSAFIKSNVLCNSDKYAFCHAIKQMPDSQRKSMQMSLNAEMEQLGEQLDGQAAAGKEIIRITNQYIQDLYRFFKLHKHRNEFDDMFAYALSLHQAHFFNVVFTEKSDRLDVATFYFVKKHYAQALDMFRELETACPTAELYQKIGYSCQQLGDLPAAMKAYERADLIAPDHVWTLKRMAVCSRLLGKTQEALRYYSSVAQLAPDDKKTLLNMGLCLLELKQYDEALNLYYKMDMEYPEDMQVCRALAWCLFVQHDHAQAEKYWTKVLDGNPAPEDYMNAAHNLFCLGNRQEAFSLYRRSRAGYSSPADFRRAFMKDADNLREQGLDADDMALLFECI